MLVHNPSDAQWFRTSRLLPRWARDTHSTHPGVADSGSEPLIRLRVSEHIPAGLAIIDAPDIDSLEPLNRERARELLEAADAWVFATTAMRYADAVPWEYLHQARDRDAVLALVLGRAPGAHVAEVSEDLHRLLMSHDLGGTPVFVFTERTDADPAEVLISEELQPLHRWLDGLIAPDSRDDLVAQTVHGATKSLLGRIETIREAQSAQASAREALCEIASEQFRITPIEDALKGGELLRGEVLKQWHEFLGTGEYFRRLEAGVSRLRDRLGRLWRKPAEGTLKEELSHGFSGLVLATAAQGAQDTYSSWTTHPGGAELLSADLATYSNSLPARTNLMVQQWQEHLLDLVRTHGVSKRTGARIAAFGMNAVAVLLMIVAFASTGGLVGAEVAIAGGTAVVAQRVLEAIFGEHGMRELAASAQTELLDRSGELLNSEAERFRSRLPEIPRADLEDSVAAIRAALRER